MRPSARIAALIELTEQVEEALACGGAPADSIVNEYFRARRYAGSKDRRAITNMFYALLRQRAMLLWSLEAIKPNVAKTGRFLVIAYLALYDADKLEMFAEEGTFAADPLSVEEKATIITLEALSISEAPEAVQLNVPEWALSALKDRFADSVEEAVYALNVQASLDMRVNTLKVDLDFIEKFQSEAEGFEKTDFSQFCVRSEKNVGLGGIPAYKRGQMEVQDEAAQVASLLVDAQPGMQVVDLCAGAGGKSLFVSAKMQNKGQIYAFDTSGKRLDECKKRLVRGGHRNVQIERIAESGEGRINSLNTLNDKCDRVYVDVPCSGTGTWRRSPDQRWRFNESDLDKLTATQFGLLEEGAGLVKAGGRLVYMTCSLLPAENEKIVEKFLEAYKGHWDLCDYKDVWSEVMDSECPETLATIPGTLQLAPHIHQTDGFYIAMFTKKTP